MTASHELEFSFKARYFKAGDLNEATQHLWFVLHGYGQLPEYFIRKFSVVQNATSCVIAPEGLSKFYVNELKPDGNRSNDRVGASWMTKENRQTDIDNYLTYLNTVYDKETAGLSIPKITVLGFSQGAATASRWILQNKIRFDRLVLWAGVFPHDMNFEKAGRLLSGKEVIQVYGTSDPFIQPDQLAAVKAMYEKAGIHPRLLSFDGKHEIDEATLSSLI